MVNISFEGNTNENAGFYYHNATVKNWVNYDIVKYSWIVSENASIGGIICYNIASSITSTKTIYNQNCLNYGVIIKQWDFKSLYTGGVVGGSTIMFL